MANDGANLSLKLRQHVEQVALHAEPTPGRIHFLHHDSRANHEFHGLKTLCDVDLCHDARPMKCGIYPSTGPKLHSA